MKKKILVVERDEDILQIIAGLLSDEGYEVNTVKSEAGAYELIKAFMPDVVLLDITRPTEQGTELCRKVKASRSIGHIPVVVLSTYINLNAFTEICADDVLSKPFNIAEVLQVVESHLAI